MSDPVHDLPKFCCQMVSVRLGIELQMRNWIADCQVTGLDDLWVCSEIVVQCFVAVDSHNHDAAGHF